MAEKTKQSMPLPFLALLLGWLIPGGGHIYLGRIRRGMIIFVTLTAIFWGGMAMGGALTFDPVNERWWFIAQILNGANGLAGWQIYKNASEKVLGPAGWYPPGSPDAHQKFAEEKIALVAPIDTAARAYSGTAGMLNLMCVFDAVILSLMGVAGEAAPEQSSRRPEKPPEVKKS